MLFDDLLKRQITDRLQRFPRQQSQSMQLKHAAVAITLTEIDGEAGFVLTKRSYRLRAHGGQWALPGGRVDEGETTSGAALREIQEEIGVSLSSDTVIGALDDYPTRSGYLVRPLIIWAGADIAFEPNPDEVDSVHVIPLSVFSNEGILEIDSIPESDRPLIRLWISDDTSIHAPTAAVLWQFAQVALHDIHERVAEYEQPVFAWR